MQQPTGQARIVTERDGSAGAATAAEIGARFFRLEVGRKRTGCASPMPS
ncbi:hypothetical protein LRS73_03060 [Methylobacterium currus]|nr:hypothetical protein [Methylobacterium currus]UHC16917.1 hypothetical protein LRS73_03060 [Methylobacterium currus]